MDARPLLTSLEGRLVRLEPLVAAHGPGIAAAAEDPEIFRWMPSDLSRPGGVERFMAAALDAGAAGREAPYVIRRRSDEQVVGSSRFMEVRMEHRRVEIGWTWLSRDVWGAGVNVECKRLLLGHAIESVGCRRVEFKTDARNERSRGALTALGAVFEGIHRLHMVLPDGGPRDSAYFSVIAPEWPALRRRLDARLAAAQDRGS